MKEYQAKNIRNISVLGHGSEGKTTLVEALLFTAGAIDRQGSVTDGNTTTDFDAEEVKRHISINAALAPLEYKDHKVNIVDVPGYFDFAGEMCGPLSACEGALIVVGAVSGLNVGAEKAWAKCDETNTARIVVVNQMDRDNANFDKALATMIEKYGSKLAPVTIPIVEGGKFVGVVSVLEGKAYMGEGKTRKEVPMPDSMADAAEKAREEIMEAAAGANDELMEKFFEEGELTLEEMLDGLRQGTREGTVVPVVCCSGTTRIGLTKVLDNIIDLLPSPAHGDATVTGINPANGEEITRKVDDSEPFSGQVFKTMADPFVGKISLIKVMSGTLTSDKVIYNVNKEKAEKPGTITTMKGKKQETLKKAYAGDIIALAKIQSLATGDTVCEQNAQIQYPAINFPQPCIAKAVYAKKSGEEDKIFSGLARLAEEDPTITITKDTETTESVLNGLGEMHIEVVVRKLKNKYQVECELRDPRIAYRESIRKPIDVEGRHKKQSGGHGQFGDVKIKFRPNDDPNDIEFHFVDSVVGGTVPRNFIPAVEKGLRDNIVHGVLAGFPVVGLTAELYDGGYHPVDSSEMAFKTAARLAFKQLTTANPVLLEPIYRYEIDVPDQYMGDIYGDMSKRRGRILGSEKVGENQRISAEAPLAEMFKYATDLRSMTQARGSFTKEFVRYEDVPAMDTKKVIEAYKKDEADED